MSKNVNSHIVDISKLSFGYHNDLDVIKNLSTKIVRENITAIIGPNGCGKTTLLKLISGVLSTEIGKISFDSQEITQFSRREIAQNIAVVKQGNVSTTITVEEYASLGRVPYGSRFRLLLSKQDKKLVSEMLELCGVTNIRESLVTELSSGQMQLVRLATALVQEPKLLLLDEPTSNLDLQYQVHTLDLVDYLVKERGVTALLVIHDINLAASYADKILVMKNGELIKECDSKTILDSNLLERVYKTPVEVDCGVVQAVTHSSRFNQS